MSTKELFKEIVENTYEIPVRVSLDSNEFWPTIGVGLGLVEPILSDFVTTMSGT